MVKRTSRPSRIPTLAAHARVKDYRVCPCHTEDRNNNESDVCPSLTYESYLFEVLYAGKLIQVVVNSSSCAKICAQ